MSSEDLRPYICLCRRLYVRVPELEDDLRVTDRKAIVIRNPPPENKGIVVESEVGGIDEEDLTDLQRFFFVPFRRESYTGLFGGFFNDITEREQTFARDKVIGLQH